jgi:murein tripeptide amidase MpaA
MITGATHARELLSTQVPLYLCLKLIHQGILNKKERYVNMLRETKFYFIPIVNMDGAALVEEHWSSEGKILNKRKNMNPNNMATCGDEDSGTDINRNFGIDWEHGNVKNRTELCSDYWPGEDAFSEPESRALRDFVGAHKSEIKFIINCHTSGNEFIWPYNGRDHNDIDDRNPGYLAIFQDIAKNAPFPSDVMKGNSHEVIGDRMGGDQDDYMLATYGIPSVTSEMGFFGQYIKDWRC